MSDRERDETKGRPVHSVDADSRKHDSSADTRHEVDAPSERVDDEAGDGSKTTTRQE